MTPICKKTTIHFIVVIFITIMCFLLAIFPSKLYAAPATITIDGVTYTYDPTVSPKTAAVTGYIVSPTTVVIPATINAGGAVYSVTSIGASAFNYCASLTNITIPDSVTSIGASAFNWCTSLANITIPDSVTSIGASAFNSCASLTNITIPDSVTSLGSGAFYTCINLASITIPDSVTNIGGATFFNCFRLASAYLLGTPIISDSAFIQTGTSTAGGLITKPPSLSSYAFYKDTSHTLEWIFDIDTRVAGSTTTILYGSKQVATTTESAWVRPMPMTCWQIYINEDNNFQFIFWYLYADNNWVRIYDMEDNLVFEADLSIDDPNLIVDLPNGMYIVRTFHAAGHIIQEFLIGKS